MRTRQEISKHISIAYNMLHWTMRIFQYKFSINHHARIQDSYILPRCAGADKVLIDYPGLRPR